MKFKTYSTHILALAGFILMTLGLYFIFIRPALLPEDLRYMRGTLQNVNENLPGISRWLANVFKVLGGYIFTTGLLTIYISYTAFRMRLSGVFILVAIGGITSIGLMVSVNFMINSDFRWVLLTFTTPWIMSLILYRLGK